MQATKKSSSSSSNEQLSGIWKSEVIYHSDKREGDFKTYNYMRLHQIGGEVVLESVPRVNDSYLVARFWLDGEIATGSWQEVTSLEGHYKGAVYHGAAQLILSKDRTKMKGKWVGFGSRLEVKSGPWKFIYLGEDDSVIEEDKRNFPGTSR